ncbi:MAG: response regulator [Pseudomonadota bacterium]
MPKAAHILLVDDSRSDIDLALEAFRTANFGDSVHTAIGGQAALDYLFGRGSYVDRKTHPLPNLVLLDIQMPDTDGIEVLRQVKATPDLKRIPVIVLTSSKKASHVAQAYELGANSFLVKPATFEDFVKLITTIKTYWLTINTGPLGPNFKQ